MRFELEVTKTADGGYVTEYEGKTIKGRDPLALDKALDKAGVPRPRTLWVRDANA